MFWAIHERLVKGLFLDKRLHNVLKTNRFETVAWVGHPTVLTFHTVWRRVGPPLCGIAFQLAIVASHMSASAYAGGHGRRSCKRGQATRYGADTDQSDRVGTDPIFCGQCRIAWRSRRAIQLLWVVPHAAHAEDANAAVSERMGQVFQVEGQ